MSLVCAACGAVNAEAARFCDQCGARVDAAATPEAGASPKVTVASAPGAVVERRQLSVMFCDLVGSTELSQSLDPEDLRDVIQAYREACRTVIESHAGLAAQYIGDGIVVYFGYPLAHEDDARRAARAGLEIVAAIRTLGARLAMERGTPLSVRIAIHTGLTIVGDHGGAAGQERLALGDTPNIAARLQALAAPDTVVVSQTTHRLIAGFFETTPLGRQTVKGVSEPVEMFRVDAVSGARHRLEAAPAHRMTPYVGRGDAVATLTRAWASAQAGSGSAELLVGEPGVGKSRLLARLRETLAQTAYEHLCCYCSPYYRSSAYHPIVEAIRVKLGLDDALAPAAQLTRLREAVAGQGSLGDGELVLALIAQLIGIPPDAGYRAVVLHPLAQKQKTAEALLALLTPSGRPTLMIVEDLHWADPTTVEFLGAVLGKAPDRPLLVLLTARPEFHSPWEGNKALGLLPVNQLSAAETETMIRRAAGGKSLPEKVVSLLVRKADGNPLFVEEMTQMLLDSPLLRDTGEAYELTGPLPDVLVPTSLQDLLTARLDRMQPDARRVLQVAATIGREFGTELLHDVLTEEADAIPRGLAALLDDGMIFGTGNGYLIKHALIQDAAYESLLKRTRQQYHERIARALASRADTARTPPEVVAAHFIKAGQPAAAIPYCLQAGQRAVASSANEEAVSHLRLGLELLAAQLPSAARDRTELELLATLGTALTMQKGWAAPEVAETYSRAEALCERVGPTPQLFWVLWGMWAFHLVRGDQHTALDAARRVMDVARGEQRSGLEVEADFTLGLTHYYRGELAAARDHLERAVAAYVPEAHHANVSLSCQDVGVTSRSVSAMVLHLLGEPERALARSQEAIALAERLRHPFSLAYALGCAAWLHAYRREPEAMAKRARELIALTRSQALDWWLIWGLIFDGRAAIDAGDAREGTRRMDEALTLYRGVGTGMVVPFFMLLLAEGDAASGEVDRALDRLAQARAVMAQGGETFASSEADRLEGDLRLRRLLAQASPDHGERMRIESLYRRALDTARAQGAVAFEERAARGLARLAEESLA